MKVARVYSICIPNLTNRLAALNFTIGSGKRLQVAVESLDERVVRKTMTDNDDFSPAGASFTGKYYRPLRGRVDRQPAIRIAARLRIPIFAQMIVLAEILGGVPAVAVLRLRDVTRAADRVVKPVGDWDDERCRLSYCWQRWWRRFVFSSLARVAARAEYGYSYERWNELIADREWPHRRLHLTVTEDA